MRRTTAAVLAVAVQSLLPLVAVASFASPASSQETSSAAPAPRAATSSRAASMLHPDSLPPATRVRLVTVGLHPGTGVLVNGTAPRRILTGTLVRMDSAPGLQYVLRQGAAEWSIPRSAVMSASRRVGRTSLGRGMLRSAIKGALAGSATALAFAEVAGKGERDLARRFPRHMGIGAVVAMAIGTQDSRDVWEALVLPPHPARR